MGAPTHDPANQIVVFAGIPLTGFADGTFLKIERTEDAYSIIVGSTGEVCRNRNNNRSGKATLTLLGSTLDNDLLSAVLELDALTGAGVAPFFTKDINSLALSESPEAWILKPPAYERAKELPNVEWDLQLSAVESFFGGQLT